MRKGIRCFSYATICAALLLVSSSALFAHQDPPGATGTGVTISLTAFRDAAATIPVLPNAVTQCETIYYRATLAWAGGNNAAIEGGILTITTPDGVPHDVTNGPIPCLGGTVAPCVPGVVSHDSSLQPYTFNNPTCPVDASARTATVAWTTGISHTDPHTDASAATQLPLTVVCCASDGLACNGAEFCDPTKTGQFCGTGQVCDENNTGGDGITHVGTCEDGTPVVCSDDNNACTAPLVCTEPLGTCVASGPDVVCDDLFCNPEACDPADGVCKPTGNVPDCDDQNACTTDTCNEETDVCDHIDNVTPTCDANCEECDTATGVCVPLDPLPAICEENEEICRTPGFWGTHGGTEKEGHSTNITLAVLGAYCGTLEICGTPVTNTDECSVESALEAICVSPKGNSCLQLGRQLTAAALNCAITKSTNSDTGACQFPDCEATPGGVGAACEGLSIGAIFAACNEECGEEPCSVTAAVDLDDNPDTPDVTVNCIGALDCFNNGLTIDTATGECTDTLSGCHERELCGDFQPPGAAGSPGECSDSRKNCVSIFGATDQCDDACVP
jgi:hypothetical protein